MTRAPETLVDLALSRGTVDRAGALRKDPTLLKRLLADPKTRVLELVGAGTPVEDRSRLVLRAPLPDDAGRLALFLGTDAGTDARTDAGTDADASTDLGRGSHVAGATAYVAVVADEGTTSGAGDDGPERLTLRDVGVGLSARDAGLFTSALALANWHSTHTHCPRCGAPTVPAEAGWTRRCTSDGSEHYPRTDPAVIMSVIDDEDRLLLARAPQWPAGRVSVLAGFVESGEPLEAAVVRETREEVGIDVTDVRYMGNQPWPFPASLMVGFTARAATTELRPDLEEIAEARWWSREDLAAAVADHSILLSPRLSIARRLIEHWYGGRMGGPGVERPFA